MKFLKYINIFLEKMGIYSDNLSTTHDTKWASPFFVE